MLHGGSSTHPESRCTTDAGESAGLLGPAADALHPLPPGEGKNQNLLVSNPAVLGRRYSDRSMRADAMFAILNNFEVRILPSWVATIRNSTVAWAARLRSSRSVRGPRRGCGGREE